MNEYDVVIIGGGAAGLSAALVLCRARHRVLVVDSVAPSNALAAYLHGFLPGRNAARDLLAAGRDEVHGYGGTITTGAPWSRTSQLWEYGQPAGQEAARITSLTSCRSDRASSPRSPCRPACGSSLSTSPSRR